MLLRDLFESASLRLQRGELPRYRSFYSAFIVTMDPSDFLRLTCPPGDYERIDQRPFPYTQDEFQKHLGGLTGVEYGRFPLPFLSVYWPSGKVKGHEGRHRAMMVMKAGGKNFPVAIDLRDEHHYTLTYNKESWDTDDVEPQVEEFTDGPAAHARLNALKANRYPEGEDFFYTDIKLDTTGGYPIKSSPTMTDPNDPWARKPFVVADMPKRLIGQYDDSITVDKFRVGLVKGYRHRNG